MNFEVLTVEQVAERLQLKRKTVVSMCARGAFPCARKAGRGWRIPDWDFKALTGAQEQIARFRDQRGGHVVYFIQCNGAGGPIKIGTTRKASERFGDLRLANAYPITVLLTVPGDRALEYALHAQFAGQRLHGEWFAPSPALVAHIDALRVAVRLQEGGIA